MEDINRLVSVNMLNFAPLAISPIATLI